MKLTEFLPKEKQLKLLIILTLVLERQKNNALTKKQTQKEQNIM